MVEPVGDAKREAQTPPTMPVTLQSREFRSRSNDAHTATRPRPIPSGHVVRWNGRPRHRRREKTKSITIRRSESKERLNTATRQERINSSHEIIEGGVIAWSVKTVDQFGRRSRKSCRDISLAGISRGIDSTASRVLGHVSPITSISATDKSR